MTSTPHLDLLFERFTTEKEVDRAVDMTCKQVNKLRELRSLWELTQEGVEFKMIQWVQYCTVLMLMRYSVP